MKYLRWQGAVTFFAFVIVFISLLYVFAEPLVKKSIEKGVAWYTGAEVNVDRVELAYSPFTLQVFDFQATDAKAPEKNLIAFKKAQADLDVWQYLFGKVLINELSIDGLAFATTRQAVGEVYLSQDTDSADETSDSADLPSIKQQLPDPKALINNSDLLTVKAGQALSTAYEQEQQKLAALKSELPDQAKLATYQEQVKALSSVKVNSLADLEKLKQDYDALKKSFKADQAIVKNAKTQLTASKEVLSNKISALKSAPGSDWQAIKTEYQLDTVESGDFAHLLFGEQAREYLAIATTVYETLAPLIANKKSAVQEKDEAEQGRFVSFADNNAQPDLLIQLIKVAIVSPQGDFLLDVKKLTNQHWLINQATVYHLASSNVYKSGKAQLTGDFELSAQGNFTADGEWLLTGVPITNAKLRDTKKLSLTLSQGDINAKGNYQLNNETLTSVNGITLANAKYDGQADGQLRNLVLDTLKSTPSLTLDIGAKGEIKQPEFSISSSLDNVLKNALSAQVDAKTAEFQGKVQTALNEKVAQSLNLQSSQANELVNLESLLNQSDGALDKLLNSDVIKQQEDKLKNKAKDKLKDKLGSFLK
ncbi:MAG: TIGR03545 family protein [Thalassotalea sp.]